MWVTLRVCIYVSLFAGRVFSASVGTPATEPAGEQEKMPEPLTSVDFSSTMSTGLHMVEFYSPLCHHCKLFAPTWEKTWKEFHKKGARMGISMAQVECLQSGDLCKQENVVSYPSIRLYGPAGYIKDYPHMERDQESLVQFMMAEARNKNNMELMGLESKSEPLNKKRFNQLLEAGVESPTLISFWPAPEVADITKVTQFRNCRYCAAFRNTWKLLSNRADTEGISTFHFSCYLNGDLCRKVGLERLTKRSGDGEKIPALALLLPNVDSLIFYERDSYAFEDFLDFVLRSYSNYLAPHISPEEVAKMLLTVPKVSDISEGFAGKTILLYNPAPTTNAEKDGKLLHSLLRELDGIPNVYIYKFEGRLKKNIDRMLDRIYTTLLERASQELVGLNKELFHLRTLSVGDPLFIMFKECSRTPIALQNQVDQEDISSRAIQWIKENSYPYLRDFTRTSGKPLLKGKDSPRKPVVIQVLDTSNEQEVKSSKNIKGFFDVISKFEGTWDEYVYKGLSRLYGDKAILKIVNGNDKTETAFLSEINEKLTENYNGVLYGYIDKSSKKALKRLGLNVHDYELENGDVLIVDEKGKFYYAKGLDGSRMTVHSPEHVVDAIRALVFPESGKSRNDLRRFLVGSPFGPRWRFFEHIHQYGFLGWFLLIVAVFFALRLPRIYKKYVQRKKYAARHDTMGILGKEGAFPE
ncbi:ADL008Wp [Eremothecium gossypii ATCC 10895]|uniref:ADL008Wp n=1 Tax=Eremothecium gossypii (strain ATCC 10895 / CBS 109.51 / FGSC 9923 / NRRL Y-1056) TaxID=284811 RepID=Q75AC5_EREGS|nr:ADL008Wp [Eremothecium gossypii ATCC 10895]AAS51913.1 ADL008Wp [Eremothecium gossypii ATCC 10895]AEY96212.1 FADL008Wp [Eremothecium gossypii FDAG1]